MNFNAFIQAALDEDIKDGDHSTLACIAPTERGQAILKIKEAGILAGVEIAKQILQFIEPSATMKLYKQDGDRIIYGEKAFEI